MYFFLRKRKHDNYKSKKMSWNSLIKSVAQAFSSGSVTFREQLPVTASYFEIHKKQQVGQEGKCLVLEEL